MLVDEYSLILFNSYEDYKIYKAHEDEVLERERVEERQRLAEEAARISKLKKKSRKSKARLEKAQRHARRLERKERRERERLERREIRRRERQEKRARGEPLIKPDKQERQMRRERHDQRLRERQERQRLRKERHDRERETRRSQQKVHKSTLLPAVITGTQSQLPGAANAPSIGISDLAQHRQRLEQLYHMRKPITPSTGNMEELVAAAAVIAAAAHAENPSSGMPTVRVTLDPRPGLPPSSNSGHSIINENALSQNPRPNSQNLKRPGSIVTGVKRPLSELDQQQSMNEPQAKAVKYEEFINEYRKLLPNQDAQQRRNSLQQQQLAASLNYPFLANMPPTADPSFRFAVPQHLIPMGLQRAAAGQHPLPPGISAATMANMLQPSLPPMVDASGRPANSNAMMPSGSQQTSQPSSVGQRPGEASNQLNLGPHSVFANNPDFASLMGANSQFLPLGMQNSLNGMPLMGANGALNPLIEAQQQLEQYHAQQRRNAQGSIGTSKTGQGSQSGTPSRKTSKASRSQQPRSQSGCSTIAGPSHQTNFDAQAMTNNMNGKPNNSTTNIRSQIGISGTGNQNAVNPGTEITPQATVPLSRPITPTFASSIGIQYPLGTALASQLAGAALLGGKASFSSRHPTGSRWNRLHINVAETLQQVFAENPEMDDGSREGQSCAVCPREYRLASSIGNPQTANNAQPSGQTSDANSHAQSLNSAATSTWTSGRGVDAKTSLNVAHLSSNTEIPATSTADAHQTATQRPSSTSDGPRNVKPTGQNISNAIEQQNIDVSNMPTADQLLRHQLLAASTSALETEKRATQRNNELRLQSRGQPTPGANRSSTNGQIAQSRFPAANAIPNTQQTAMPNTPALHPTLGAIGIAQQTANMHSMAQALLPQRMPAGNMTPDNATLMNLLYQQHQSAQQKELQKKNELRQKEEELLKQRQRAIQQSQSQQRPSTSNQQSAQLAAQQQAALQMQQQLLAMSGMQTALGAQAQLPQNYLLQNLPAATQFMLQEAMASQHPSATSNQTSGAAVSHAGLPANLLESLVAQNSRIGQFPSQVSSQPSQTPGASVQRQITSQQSSHPNLANFPPAAAQPSLTHGTAGNVSTANVPRHAALDPSQLYAFSLLQNQAQALDAHNALNATNAAQSAQTPSVPLNLDAINNPDALRQLQQNLLERSMNPALYAQLLQSQQQSAPQQNSLQLQNFLMQQQQQQLQRGIAPVNANQLANLVGGIPNFLEAELLMRQMSGQQPPSNLQRTAQDRQQVVAEHRLFQQQLMAAANGAQLTPMTSQAQLAAHLRNGTSGSMAGTSQKKI
ncbi:hypothetical protein M3Y94_00343000 [Aphelenchoides besseyi]|nr:hypothetical protein M3Y94_00343000 [Aphelenchoides besseyi]